MKPVTSLGIRDDLSMKWNKKGLVREHIRDTSEAGSKCLFPQAKMAITPSAPVGDSRGFALVVTLSLMILLTLVAVGLLSLSAVSMRSSSQSKAESDARANARMALMFALGELQKHTGQDTRITAPADIVEPNAPTLTGVWKSWEGTDHDGTGRPILDELGRLVGGSAGGRSHS